MRWSGESTWVPLGNLSVRCAAGERDDLSAAGRNSSVSWRRSETEILIPYGRTQFGSKAGLLAGNHFLTIVSGAEHLAELGTADAVEGRAADPDRSLR